MLLRFVQRFWAEANAFSLLFIFDYYLMLLFKTGPILIVRVVSPGCVCFVRILTLLSSFGIDSVNRLFLEYIKYFY